MGVQFVAPPLKLCTDNGAMIAWAGIERDKLNLIDDLKYDYIIDGSDNFQTKFLINDICKNSNKFLITGAISKFDGHIFTFDFKNEKTPCIRSFFQEKEISDNMLRKELRKNIVEFKKNRRISLGPYATFYFESYETMLAQVQEMLYIEKGGDEQLKDELTAYNPLIPNGKELTATLMFEIDNPVSRSAFLGKVGGIEEKVFIKIEGEIVKAIPEEDVDRTSAEGKASSVQFIHFKFSDEQIQKFKLDGAEVEIGIDHKEYSHTTKLSLANLSSLSADFS